MFIQGRIVHHWTLPSLVLLRRSGLFRARTHSVPKRLSGRAHVFREDVYPEIGWSSEIFSPAPPAGTLRGIRDKEARIATARTTSGELPAGRLNSQKCFLSHSVVISNWSAGDFRAALGMSKVQSDEDSRLCIFGSGSGNG